MRALDQIEQMSPAEAVPMLLDGIAGHPSNEVRCHCIRALLPYDLTEPQIKVIAAALDHESAQVRHAAVSYFLLRGSQGRPVVGVVPHLVRMLEQPNMSSIGNSPEESMATVALPMTIASALMTTVGAKKVQIRAESPDMEGFRSTLLSLLGSDDPVLRSDAKKYLRMVFGM
jgi:hypothetical protein